MIREITISPVLNGFVCKVGCQKVVFNSITEMVRGIEQYYKNPEEVERQYVKSALNKMDGPEPQPCMPMESVGSSVLREACDSPRISTRG